MQTGGLDSQVVTMGEEEEKSFLVKAFQRLRIYKLAPTIERYDFERNARAADEMEASRCFLNNEKLVTIVPAYQEKSSQQVCQEIAIASEDLETLPKHGIMSGEIIRQLMIGLVCNLLIIDSGMQEGWATPTIPKFSNKDDPLDVNSDEIAWIVNLLYVGVGFGSVVSLLVMDRIGRKKTLFLAALPKIISWIMVGVANTLTTIICGRVLAGIGCGITYAVMPMYLGEVSSKRTRGPLGTMMMVLLNGGLLLISATGLWISRFTMAMLGMTLPILFVILYAWLPESSIFLTKKNRLSLAKKTLRWALVKENVEEEFDEIKRIVATEDSTKKLNFIQTINEALSKGENRRAFGISLILLSALTLTGGPAILSYQSDIFEEAKFHVPTNLSIIVTGCAIVLAGLICVLVVRTTGKRPLLLVGVPVCFFSLATLATFFTLSSNGSDVSNFNWIPLVFIVIYIISYGLALSPIPLAYVGEIFTLEMKAAAAIFSTLYYAIVATILIKFYQITKEWYGTYAPLWTFASITLILWLLIYMYVPETEGKTLEEIQIDLKKKR